MKKWTIDPFVFTVVFAADPKEIRDPVVRRRLTRLVKDGGSSAFCHMSKDTNTAYILLVPDKTASFPDLVDSVAHEVFHVVGFLYEAIGEDARIRDVSEPPAYWQGFLTGEIIRALGYS